MTTPKNSKHTWKTVLIIFLCLLSGISIASFVLSFKKPVEKFNEMSAENKIDNVITMIQNFNLDDGNSISKFINNLNTSIEKISKDIKSSDQNNISKINDLFVHVKDFIMNLKNNNKDSEIIQMKNIITNLSEILLNIYQENNENEMKPLVTDLFDIEMIYLNSLMMSSENDGGYNKMNGISNILKIIKKHMNKPEFRQVINNFAMIGLNVLSMMKRLTNNITPKDKQNIEHISKEILEDISSTFSKLNLEDVKNMDNIKNQIVNNLK
jgi:hypothetical protein